MFFFVFFADLFPSAVMVSRAWRLRPQRRQAAPGAVSQRQHGLQGRHHAGAGRQQSCCSRAQGGLGNGNLDRHGQQPPPTARPTARCAAAHCCRSAVTPRSRQGLQESAGLVIPAPPDLIAEDHQTLGAGTRPSSDAPRGGARPRPSWPRGVRFTVALKATR